MASTPRSIWIALGLIFAGVAFTVSGYFLGRSVPEGFQGAATFAMNGAIGVLLCLAGMVCALRGARHRPRSAATKTALVVAGVVGLALVWLAIRILVVLL